MRFQPGQSSKVVEAGRVPSEGRSTGLVASIQKPLVWSISVRSLAAGSFGS